jgi:hypothetical protein
MIENPVGVLSSIYNKPSFIFDPCDYGGYLPESDIHPAFPNYIPPRDGYLKKTCIWKSKNLQKPLRKLVQYVSIEDRKGNRFSPQAALLGGKSEFTKMVRSLTPRGYARAFFEMNYPIMKEKENGNS